MKGNYGWVNIRGQWLCAQFYEHGQDESVLLADDNVRKFGVRD